MSSTRSVLYSFWLPSPSAAFRWLLVPRLLGAFFMHISDCDETYNYWEPAHHLLYGGGFQTWEYSPTFALRSYAYLLIHLFPLLATNTANKLIVFYLLRAILAVACALCEIYFYRAVVFKFGPAIGRLTLLLLMGSCGMYIAAPAFLPTSFTMYLGMLALGAWLQRDYEVAIFSVAMSSLVGWPFSAALGLPIALDIVFYQRRVLFFVLWSAVSFFVIAGPLAAVDSIYYGKFVLAPWNIIMYNVFGQGGPHLYGVEPWYFYFINGLLNFNVVFILALLSLMVVEFQVFWEVLVTVLGTGTSYLHTASNIISAYRGTAPSASLYIRSHGYRQAVQPMVIWILIFFTRPHKEERFMFPVYPLYCLCAAITVHLLPEVSTVLLGLAKVPRPLRRLSSLLLSHLPSLTVLVHTLCSLSRAWALYNGYHAPMEVYKAVNSHEVLSYTEQFSGVAEINLCVGKEWHRFPSSFFLPDKRWQLRFIQSEFKGQLPQPYSRHSNSTTIIPDHMNDMNQEEPSRYFPVADCHFLMDFDLPETTPLQPRYAQDTVHWDTVAKRPFLDASRSHRLYRAFYIPWLSRQHTSYADYALLKNRDLFSELKRNYIYSKATAAESM